VAKAYRLLHTILGTAVDDGLIRRNPCRIKGAATERAPERPTLTLPQVAAMADAVGPRSGCWCCSRCWLGCGGVS